MKKLILGFFLLTPSIVFASGFFGGTSGSAASIGGLVTGGLDTSVLFIHPNGTLAQDTSNFGYSLTNHQLSLGVAPIITPFSVAGLVHNSAAGLLSSSLLVNADVSGTAAIAYSKLSLAGSVNLASDVTGLLPVANGGTHIASGTSGGILGYTGTSTIASSALLTSNAIVVGGGSGATPSTPVGLGTSTTVLHGNAGGAPSFGSVSLTADISGILGFANGGTNASSAAAGFNNLSPMSTLGDIEYESAVNTASRLAGNTTSTKKFLTQTGTGTVSAAPAWAQIVGSDLPNPSSSTLGGIQSAAAVSHQWINSISTSGVPALSQPAFTDVSGIATTAQGGTGQNSTATFPTSGTVVAITPANHGTLVSSASGTATVTATGSAGTVLTSNGASADPSYQTAPAIPVSSYEVYNLGLTNSTASSALTISIKQSDGATDPSTGTAAVKIGFKNTIASNGNVTEDSVTSATSIVIPSTATLGTVSGKQSYIYLYGVDAGSGVWVPAVSLTLFDEGTLQTTTTIAGGSNSAGLLYAAAGASTRPIRLLARLSVNEVTAGTWATVATEVSLLPFKTPHAGAYGAAQTPTGTVSGSYNIVKFGTITKDVAGNYSSTTGLFTVTEPGWYAVSATLDIQATFTNAQYAGVAIIQNSTQLKFGFQRAQVATAEDLTPNISYSVYAAVGDTIGIQSICNGTTPSFSGTLSNSDFSIVWMAP